MPFLKRAYGGRKPAGRNASEKGIASMKKYLVGYMLTDGRGVDYGMIEEENGKFLASKHSPHRKAFNTLREAIASFELVEALNEGYIASFSVSVDVDE